MQTHLQLSLWAGSWGSSDPPLWLLCFRPYPCSLCTSRKTKGSPETQLRSHPSTAETQDLPIMPGVRSPFLTVVLSPPSHFYSIKPASQPFLGLTQPLSIKVFATAVPTAWNSPPTHTPSPTTKRLPLPLLMSPCKYHLSETPSLTTLSDGDTPPAGSATFFCFIFLLGTCSLSFLHSLSV